MCAIFASITPPDHRQRSRLHESRTFCNDYRMTNLANLDRVAHKNLCVQEELAFAACKDITMCAVMLAEIPRLVIEYPLAFTKHSDTGQYICVALFGVDPERNLYWHDDRWSSVNVPLNIGRQPFFVGVADKPAAGEGAKGLVTCIDLGNPAVQTDAGEPLFNENGTETPYLRHKLTLLAELIDGEPKSRAFTDRLVALDLLQAIQLELSSPGQAPRKISGLYSVDEAKLRSLDAATLAELHGAGYLHAMYAMLSSLGHLQILARRSAPSAASANA